MKTSRSHSAAPQADRAAKEEHTKRRASGEFPPEIPKRWKWHYETLARLRDRLIEERSEALSEAAEPVERHSLHQADSATNEFDHELALSQLSAEQDALYEVEAAMRRILDGMRIPCGAVALEGALAVPQRANGVVVFAHGSDSSRQRWWLRPKSGSGSMPWSRAADGPISRVMRCRVCSRRRC